MYFPTKILDTTGQKNNSIIHENMSHPKIFFNV